ncbi:MAG: hypothetical protein SWK76_04490 [Actinomycetota bacterium]|nr:hypothetical protein [Actinomycetota bacterium]
MVGVIVLWLDDNRAFIVDETVFYKYITFKRCFLGNDRALIVGISVSTIIFDTLEFGGNYILAGFIDEALGSFIRVSQPYPRQALGEGLGHHEITFDNVVPLLVYIAPIIPIIFPYTRQALGKRIGRENLGSITISPFRSM